jgi:hypothetical protein
MESACKILILSTPTGKRDKFNYHNERTKSLLSKRYFLKTISKLLKAMVEGATMDMTETPVARSYWMMNRSYRKNGPAFKTRTETTTL